MRTVEIIEKKRDREVLSRDEIDYFVQGFTRGEIPDYQVSAWAMAVVLNSMTVREVTDLTLAMAYSGDTIDLSHAIPIAVDKHSTGGVGDKTTLVVEPIVAACGLPVAKMSGRGLGFTGGTLDKVESIPGFRVNMTTTEFIQQLKDIGLVLSGQTADLAPADGLLYALRDVTGTIPSIPLIASSIMSKKIAAGAQAIVLDVKVGNGAFLKSLDGAVLLAETMVGIAEMTGRKAVALISDMNQPLGLTVGNSLEVKEALLTMRGLGPLDFTEHCLEVASQMLVLGGQTTNKEQGRSMAVKALQSGKALEKFVSLIEAQGGDSSYIYDTERFPRASLITDVRSYNSGYLKEIHAQIIGEVAVDLGAGRTKKEEAIDHSVGIELHCKVGDFTEIGQVLFTIHANQPALVEPARVKLLSALTWSDTPVECLPLFYTTVTTKGTLLENDFLPLF